jgi:hypothetical protein
MNYKNHNLENLENEVWVDMKGYEEYYQASNLGRIKRKTKYRNKSTKYLLIRKILKQTIYLKKTTKNGYLYITLFDKNPKTVHRLIAKSFIPNPKNKPCVNHIDGFSLNNNVSNLEWCTYSENTQHAYKTGLMDSLKGENNTSAKLTKDEVIEIRNYPKKITNVELGKIYNISDKTISSVRLRRTWKHI